MKITLVIIALLTFTSPWAATANNKKDAPIDSCLVISNEKKTIVIEQGKRIFVRIGQRKINGAYTYATDSTIYVEGIEVNLSEIHMIAKSKTGKTVGMFFLQLPASLFGFAIAALSSSYNGDAFGTIGGLAIVGAGLTAATLESYRGKRYNTYKNWSFTVRRLN